MMALYIKNCLKVESPEMHEIQDCAAENNIAVCLGFSRNINNSLYIAQAIISRKGEMEMTRRKIKATHLVAISTASLNNPAG